MNAQQSSNESEQIAKVSKRMASELAEGASHATDAAARVSDQTMRAGAEVLQRNVETAQRTFEDGAKLASGMTERSATQFGRLFGFSGEAGEKAVQTASRNMEVIVHSSAALTEMMQRMCEEWRNIAGAGIQRNFDRMGALMQSRTPQEFAAVQSEFLRDNIEIALDCTRKAAEAAIRLSDEAKRRVGNLAESRQAT